MYLPGDLYASVAHVFSLQKHFLKQLLLLIHHILKPRCFQVFYTLHFRSTQYWLLLFPPLSALSQKWFYASTTQRHSKKNSSNSENSITKHPHNWILHIYSYFDMHWHYSNFFRITVCMHAALRKFTLYPSSASYTGLSKDRLICTSSLTQKKIQHATCFP